jgi:toxin-antitoxin system PIN domain toxin
MILIDVNLLIYAYTRGAKQHVAARKWFESVASSDIPVLLPWHSVLGFLRVSTNPRVADSPFSIEEAAAIVDEWMANPRIRTVQAGRRHWEILRSLLIDGQCRGQLVPDAHLAALAIEHGATLATHDRGFARFKGLSLSYPLEEGL